MSLRHGWSPAAAGWRYLQHLHSFRHYSLHHLTAFNLLVPVKNQPKSRLKRSAKVVYKCSAGAAWPDSPCSRELRRCGKPCRAARVDGIQLMVDLAAVGNIPGRVWVRILSGCSLAIRFHIRWWRKTARGRQRVESCAPAIGDDHIVTPHFFRSSPPVVRLESSYP